MLKSMKKFNIFLHKKDVNSFEGCLKKEFKDSSKENIFMLKKSHASNGRFYRCDETSTAPEWQNMINEMIRKNIPTMTNTSNKGLLIMKVEERYFSIPFGYGRAMIDDSTIQRHFGLRTALNLIDENKIKSLNSMSLEDVLVDSQQQSSSFTQQSQFQISELTEVLKKISGAPNSETIASFIAGSDSLSVSRRMSTKELESNLRYYLREHGRDKYKRKGFEWIDNIHIVQDKIKKDLLNEQLCEQIKNGVSNSLTIAPNQIIEWEDVEYFYFNKLSESDRSIIIDSSKYFSAIEGREIDIFAKLKRDSLQVKYIESDELVRLDSIYKSMITEVEIDGKYYLLAFGDWYEIKSDFFSSVNDFINNIPITSINLPEFNHANEGEYNSAVCSEEASEFCLLDKINYSTTGYGRSRVEPCDILTRDNKMIHVKVGGGSSKLSHLVSQGLVASKIFANDPGLKEHINLEVAHKFGEGFFSENIEHSEIEIVYAIIDKGDRTVYDALPFFIKVNLMNAIQELQAMKFKYSIYKIRVSE